MDRDRPVFQQLHRVDDGELVAELTSVGGLLDLGRRRLVEAPDEHWRRLARRPELLGLDPGQPRIEEEAC